MVIVYMSFVTHVATIVSCLVLLNKQISQASFPPSWQEAIRLEVSSVLAQPSLIQNDRYRAALPKHLQREIVAEPWLRTLSTLELVTQVEDCLRTTGTLDQVSRDLEAVFDTDPTVHSVVRRGLHPIRNADVIVEAVDATAEVFEIEYNTLEEPVRTMYTGLFRRLGYRGLQHVRSRKISLPE